MKYMTTDQYTNDSGMLDVGDGHSIWWHDWGNKNAAPIFALHGGSGGGFKDKYKLSFDPTTQRVIFHDQRGSGQSTPYGSIEHNTTQDLVADIEKLRETLGIETLMLTGGSWGSCLALVYAITYPKRVSKMLLGGIFTGTRAETDYIQQGGLKTHYPEAWEQYIEVVPEDQRNNTVRFYLDKFIESVRVNPGTDPTSEPVDDPNLEFVRRWCLLEGSAMSLDGDYSADLMGSFDVDIALRTLAIMEAHYFTNNCFLPDNFILKNAHTLSHIPIILMQGRQDHVCPPETAYALQKALGEKCHLHLMPGGHARELVTREVMNAYTFSFLRDAHSL